MYAVRLLLIYKYIYKYAVLIVILVYMLRIGYFYILCLR